MSLRHRAARGGLHLGLGQAVAQACAFLRNVLLARIISPENFGIAAAFAMTYALLDMMSQLAPDVQLVQAADGDRPEFQSTAQAVQALRGVLLAVVLLLVAHPVARLFGAPQMAWAFATLALLPLARGLVHLDLNRGQREMDFHVAVRAEVASNLASLAATLPLALWQRDASAMLYLLLLQAVVYVAASHWRAQRRYTWNWDRAVVRRILTFGWPLLVNGLLMYGIFQGDRVAIGAAPRLFAANRYTLADLGVYSAAFGLAMALFLLLSNVAGQLFLPLLARAVKVPEEFCRRYDACCHSMTALAVVVVLPLIASATWTVRAVYGLRYSAGGAILAGLAAMFGLRLMRVPATLAAMAYGDTRNAMWSNLARSAALVGVVAAAAGNAPLAYLPLCGIAGEAVALWVSAHQLHERQGVSSVELWRALPVVIAGTMLAAVLALLAGEGDLPRVLAVASASVAMTLGALLGVLPQMYREWTALRTAFSWQRKGALAPSALPVTPASAAPQG